MLKRIKMFFAMLAALMLIAAPAMASEEPIRVSTFDELEKEAGYNNITRTIVLTDNIKETTKYLVINGTLTLDLDGHTLDITPATDNYAINVTSNSHLIIKNAGTLKTTTKLLYVFTDAALTISDGTFLGPIDIRDKSQTTITGGAFSVDPWEYLKDEYESKKETDGLYHVRRKTEEKPSIKFEQKELTLPKGETKEITATISGVTEDMVFGVRPSSSSPEVVEVKSFSYGYDSATITVYGQNVGESVLTATLTYGDKTTSADCIITVSGSSPTPPGPIDYPPTPVDPVIGNVSEDVKAEIKPERAVTEGDPAKAAKNIGDALTVEQLTIKDGNTIVKPEVAVKAANKLGTLSSVTSKDVVALPVFTTPAKDADKDKTIMISYEVLGSDLKAKKPADVKVMKILGAEKGELFTYASAITKNMDKKFTVMKKDGTIFTGEIDGHTLYDLALFIKDGGKFDLDGKKDGAVADPSVILGAEKRAPGGSSGGCNAGLGVLALLLSLAAIPLVYRRKK